jgi:hypothetical protein
MATLIVSANADRGSLLRVESNDRTAIKRVRIRLPRPDLGKDLLDAHPSGDGGWLRDGNNVFDDARAMFGFSVDPLTGAPASGQL